MELAHGATRLRVLMVIVAGKPRHVIASVAGRAAAHTAGYKALANT
jgi:hypothetical protein